ncbi:hypothetical protein CRUP_026900 [Coryphaenoides rupestris]|nr:hypothetical protein CRUP_026900 [Coryphaenoides rupestris]
MAISSPGAELEQANGALSEHQEKVTRLTENLAAAGELKEELKTLKAEYQTCRSRYEEERGRLEMDVTTLGGKLASLEKSSIVDRQEKSRLEKELRKVSDVAGESQGSRVAFWTRTKACEELATLYNHVCMCNNETPNRVMLDYYKEGRAGGAASPKGRSADTFSVRRVTFSWCSDSAPLACSSCFWESCRECEPPPPIPGGGAGTGIRVRVTLRSDWTELKTVDPPECCSRGYLTRRHCFENQQCPPHEIKIADIPGRHRIAVATL